MKQISKNKYDSLQVLRGLAALAVVYIHIKVISERFLDVKFDGIWADRGDLGVSLFFVLSGFIMVLIHWENIVNKTGFKIFLLKRFNRIYPLLWVLLSIKLLFLFIFPYLGTDSYSLKEILNSYLLMPSKKYVIDAQWTLVFEMVFYISFSLAILSGKKICCIGILVWCLCLMLVNYNPFTSAVEKSDSVLLSPIILQFISGGAVAYLFRKIKFTRILSCVTLILSLIATITALYYDYTDHLLWAVIFGLLVFSVVMADSILNVNWPRPLVKLGDASYSIYLIHSPVIILLCLLIKKIGFLSYLNTQLLLYICGVISIIVGFATYYCIELPLLRYGRKILHLEIKNQ